MSNRWVVSIPYLVIQRKKTHPMRKKLELVKSDPLPPRISRNYRSYFEIIVFLSTARFSEDY
jgi:hypothetical protein